jgi:hypothetical protein
VTASTYATDSYFQNFVVSPAVYSGETVSASLWLRVPSGTLATAIYIVNAGSPGMVGRWSDTGDADNYLAAIHGARYPPERRKVTIRAKGDRRKVTKKGDQTGNDPKGYARKL